MRKNLGVKAFLYPQPTLVIATYNEDGTANAMVAAWGSVSDTFMDYSFCLYIKYNVFPEFKIIL